MWVLRLLAIIVCTLLPYSTGQAASIQMPIDWSGESIFGKDGHFTGCSAQASFKSGVTIYLFAYQNYHLDFGFQNPVWVGTKGIKQDVWLQFGPAPWVRFQGNYLEQDFIYVTIPENFQDNTVKNLSDSRLFHMRFGDLNYDFEPTNVQQVLSGLSSCIKNNTTEPSQTNSANNSTVTQPTQSNASSSPPANDGPSTGSGIIVGGDGYVLTNHHVVTNCSSIQFTQEGSPPQHLAIVREDVANDLAILKADRRFQDDNVARIRVSPSPKAGETVAVYGFPFAGILSQSGNIVGGNISSLAGLNDDVRYFQITAPVQPGNSGGPLMDEAGNIIGIVNARINDLAVLKATGTVPQNINFSIKANIVTSFLDTHSISYLLAQSYDKLSLSDIGTKAKKFSVLITCN